MLHQHKSVFSSSSGARPQVCAEIGVSLEAKFAQHIPLLFVVVPQLDRFYVILIKSIIFLILYVLFSRNMTFSPPPGAFFVFFAFSESHRGCMESQNLEAAASFAVNCMRFLSSNIS